MEVFPRLVNAFYLNVVHKICTWVCQTEEQSPVSVGVSVTMRVEGVIEVYLGEPSPVSLAISTLSKVQFISSNLYPGI